MANKAFMELDETYQSVQEEIEENANKTEFEIPAEADVIDVEVVEEVRENAPFMQE